MKKNLFVILGIFILIVAICSFLYYNYRKLTILANQTNQEYEKYTQTSIIGSSLMSLINKATNQNEKNEIPKDEKNYYIENEENSIKIEIKFLESDKTYPMEDISRLGSEEFIKNYNRMNFICTKKEYHKTTKQIKYMLFEQI